MFPLTRPVRQGLATAVLIAFTVVPVGLVAAYAWRINRPGHIRDVEIELGRQLGLQVTLDAVRYPRPGEVVYLGIVLRQEEPRKKGLVEIARAGVVRAVRADRELTLHVENLKLSGESPRQALAQVGTLLQRSGTLPFERVNLAAPVCELDLGHETLRYGLSELAGEFVADPAHPTFRLAYRLAEPGCPAHCELVLKRDRDASPVRTLLVLKTLEGLPLPARVLGVFFDAADWLGPGAQVEGTLALSQAGGSDWDAEFQGSLIDLDLSSLVGKRFPRHHLAGTARLVVEQARWGDRPGQGPGWREVSGELTAGRGSIGVSLVQALSREMKFRLAPRTARIDPNRTDIDFLSLGLGFAMESSGEIQISGALGHQVSPGTVLAGATAPLVFAPAGTASVHGLIKTLFPVADSAPGSMVPLTSESRLLLCLPLAPEIAAKPGRRLGSN